MPQITVECPSCRGTGLYHGFVEGPGEFVICASCGGTGATEIHYKEFTGRKEPMADVSRVRAGSGTILDDATKAQWISYAEFKRLIP